MKRHLIYLLSATLVAGCARADISTIIEDLRDHRREANEQVTDLLKEQALESEETHTPSEYEQALEERHAFSVIGLPEQKTQTALETIAQRFDLYNSLFGPNTTLERIFLLEDPDDFDFYSDRNGHMEFSTRDMVLYTTSIPLIDHEYTHTRQIEGSTDRHAALTQILEDAGEQFQNEHYDPDTPSIWDNGTVDPRGYFFTPYSNKNVREYEAEFFEEVSKLIRGEPNAFKNIDRTLSEWPKILNTLTPRIIPDIYASFMKQYIQDDTFKEFADNIQAYGTSFEQTDTLTETLDHQDAAILAGNIMRNHPDLARELCDGTIHYLLVFNECIRDPEPIYDTLSTR